MTTNKVMLTFYFLWRGNNPLLRKSVKVVKKIEAPTFEEALQKAEKLNEKVGEFQRIHEAFLAVPIDEQNWLSPKWGQESQEQ